jgi:Plasmid replication region DNA-binding N-term
VIGSPLGPKAACTTPFRDGEMETVTDPTYKIPRIPKASRTKVWEAADAILLGSGERPTVEAVRQRLGGGSPNSVTAYLNEWYRELAERLSAADAPIEGVPVAALALLRDLWRVAREGQGAGLRAVQDVDGLAEAELEALKAQVKALETLNLELRRHRATTEKALVEAKALLSHREASAAEERERLVELETALTAVRLELEVLRARKGRSAPTAQAATETRRRPRAKPSRPKSAKPAMPKTASRTGNVKPKETAVPKRRKGKQTRTPKARRRR